MKQSKGFHFCWANESAAFTVSDADDLFFACKYVGSSLGFVMDKDVFNRQLQKGRILELQEKSIAV